MSEQDEVMHVDLYEDACQVTHAMRRLHQEVHGISKHQTGFDLATIMRNSGLEHLALRPKLSIIKALQHRGVVKETTGGYALTTLGREAELRRIGS